MSRRQEAHEGSSGLKAGQGPRGRKWGQGMWASLALAKAVNEEYLPETPCQAGPAAETGWGKKQQPKFGQSRSCPPTPGADKNRQETSHLDQGSKAT